MTSRLRELLAPLLDVTAATAENYPLILPAVLS